MKKYVSMFLAVCMLMGTTAFAISDTDLEKCREQQYNIYRDLLENAVSYTGGKVTNEFDTSKVLPYYWIRNDGVSLFKDYEKGNFEKQFYDDVFSFFYVSNETDKQIIEVNQKYNKETDSYIFAVIDNQNQYELSFAFDDMNIAKLLNSENISEVKSMRIADISYLSSFYFLYINTDKGEYVILYRDLKKNIEGKPNLKANTLYTADDFVDYCLAAAEIENNGDVRNDKNGETLVDFDGDIIEITPVPQKSEAPKATSKPTATQTATENPKETEKPQPTTKPIITSDPPAPTKAPLTVKGGDNIAISVGDEKIVFPDAQPFIDDNGRTQIPIRAVAEMLDSEVKWDGETGTVTITNGNSNTVTLQIDSDIMTVNGKSVQMDTAAIIKGDRTYIPVRFIAEAMGLTVEWVK